MFNRHDRRAAAKRPRLADFRPGTIEILNPDQIIALAEVTPGFARDVLDFVDALATEFPPGCASCPAIFGPADVPPLWAIICFADATRFAGICDECCERLRGRALADAVVAGLRRAGCHDLRLIDRGAVVADGGRA